MTILSLLRARLRDALAGIATVDPQVAATADSRFGDYQTNVAMTLARELRLNPRQLAQQIAEKLDLRGVCEPPEIAGAGFINFRLCRGFVAERLGALMVDERLGVAVPDPRKQIVVDFSSPNVAKPMHVGHIRSTILGDAIARIAEFAGHTIIRDNHIGDWGTQFGMLLVGWKSALDTAALGRDPLAEMERIYKKISARCKEDPATLERAREELVRLQNGDEENLRLWREMTRLSETQFETIYRRLNVRFDVTLGESFYNSRLTSTIAALRAAGVSKESEGAWCVFSDGSLPQERDPFLIKDRDGWRANPAIVQKSDGAANYMTTDLATLNYRLEEWAPNEIVYVTDGRQQLHFRQLFAIFHRWQPQAAANVALSHVWFGSILGEDGKPFKTRTGESVRLSDLLNEAEERALAIVTAKNPGLPEPERKEIARIIGIGAVKYADLLPNRQSDYAFSWEKMLSLTGNTAPYLQNACVRIRSIFRKAEANGGGRSPEQSAPRDPGEKGAEMHALLGTTIEEALAKKLLQFGEVVPQVLDDYRPNLLANYLYEVATAFHRFFEECPVLRAEPALRAARLELCGLTERILRHGLQLLGIEVPARM